MKTSTEETGNTLIMTAIAAGLGYMAYGSGWHSALFGFLAFVAHAVGNRLSRELAETRAVLRKTLSDEVRR